jgi:hypothetical protein
MSPRLVRFTTTGSFGPRGVLRYRLQSICRAISSNQPANAAAVISTNCCHTDAGTAINIPVSTAATCFAM